MAARAERETPFKQTVIVNESKSKTNNAQDARGLKFGKNEKRAVGLVLCVWLIALFLNLSSQVKLSNHHNILQNVQHETAIFEADNRNLEQELQELSRYDRILSVASELGLEMNEANIRNVSR